MKENYFELERTTGHARWYVGTTKTGEKITVEIADCKSDFKYRRSLAWFWRYNHEIKTKRGEKVYDYKSVQTYCERPNDKHGLCLALYNPTIKANGRQINHIYDKSNDETILRAIWKKANANKETSDPKKWGEFDNLYMIGDKQYRKLYNKARKLFVKLFESYITMQNRYATFENENCFISSSSLHGFYFPNINTHLLCIAFKNGQPVALYDAEA